MSQKPRKPAVQPASSPLISHDPENHDLRPYLVAARRELMERLLEHREALPDSLIRMGKAALSGRMKLLSLPETLDEPISSMVAPWPLYVLLSCQAALAPGERGNWTLALPSAVAVEIALAAADLLDEITDDDPSSFVEEYGVGQALNTLNLMQVMSQRILQRTSEHEGHVYAMKALGALQDMLMQAAVGQHFDMLYENMGVDEVNLEMSAHMLELKAGALMSGACRIGAITAGADDHVIGLLARFGKEIGCMAQIANDIRDVLPVDQAEEGVVQPKTDLQRRKRTLPIVFTLRDDSEVPNALQIAYASGSAPEAMDEHTLRQAVLDVGGIQFANLVAEVHLQHALEIVDEIEALRPGAREVLRPMLP